jgi:hypothetical protein
MAQMDPQQEFTLLADTLPRAQQMYMTYIASGLTEDEAAKKLDKTYESVRVGWKTQGKHAPAFNRCLELAKENPYVVEALKIKILRANTLDALNDEVANGNVDRNGKQIRARGKVLELAALTSNLVDLRPQVVHNQLNVLVSEGMNRMAQAMQQQLERVNDPYYDVPSLVDDEAIKSMIRSRD